MLYETTTEIGFSYPDVTSLPVCTVDNGVPVQYQDGYTAVHVGLLRKPPDIDRMEVVSGEAGMQITMLDARNHFTCLYGGTIAGSLPFLTRPVRQLDITTQRRSDALVFWMPKEVVVPELRLCMSAFIKRTAIETTKKSRTRT